MKIIFKYLKKYKTYAILALLLNIFAIIVEISVPTVLTRLVDDGLLVGDYSAVTENIKLMLIFTLASGTFAIGNAYFGTKMSAFVGRDLMNELYSKVMSFSHSETDIFGTSTLITRISNDTGIVALMIMMLVRVLFRMPFLFVVSIIMSFILDYRMALILLAITPLVISVVIIIARKGMPKFVKMQALTDNINQVTRENLVGIRVVKSFNRYDGEIAKFEQVNTEYKENMLSVSRIFALSAPLLMLILNITMTIVIYFAVTQGWVTSQSCGKLITFNSYVTYVMLSLTVFGNFITFLTRVGISLKRISQVMDTPVSLTSTTEYSKLSSDQLIFDNVSFGYKFSENLVLKNISFSIRKGEKLGIIGSTGSGKSTLISLIPRFYDVSRGSIHLFGNNVKDYPLTQLRNLVSIIEQDTMLLSGTIYDNILFGNQDATYEQVVSAAEKAQILQQISQMEDGFHTIIGQRGKGLSGGQRQRVAIARGFVRNSPIMVYDDSTSALDTITEKKIHTQLNKLTDSIIIIVAQRISSIIDCDKILVLDEGAVVGYGVHQELMKTCQVYKDIARTQMDLEGEANGN